MDVTDIERAAAAGKPMPKELRLSEQLLFLTLRELYHSFKSGAVSREQGSMEKKQIMKAYDQVLFEQNVLDEHLKIRRRIERELGSLHKNDCEACRRVARVFDGIDRRDIPESLTEALERNERLLELVRERSDRAAELRTQLDRIAWVLKDEKLPADAMIHKIKEVLDNEN